MPYELVFKKLGTKRLYPYHFSVWFSEYWLYQIRPQKKFYDVSIYVHTKYRSRGFAAIMLSKIVDRVGTKKLQASVHVKNEASLRVFLNCDFNIIAKEQNFVRLEYC